MKSKPGHSEKESNKNHKANDYVLWNIYNSMYVTAILHQIYYILVNNI